jgi:predicted ATPase
MLLTLAIANYRLLKDLVIPLQRLNLVTGPNGSGKSNLYRALRLLAETAQGRVITSLAREGGLQSTLWAGPESFSRAVLRGDHPVQGTTRKKPVSLRLGFAGDDFGYAIDLGLPSCPRWQGSWLALPSVLRCSSSLTQPHS